MTTDLQVKDEVMLKRYDHWVPGRVVEITDTAIRVDTYNYGSCFRRPGSTDIRPLRGAEKRLNERAIAKVHGVKASAHGRTIAAELPPATPIAVTMSPAVPDVVEKATTTKIQNRTKSSGSQWRDRVLSFMKETRDYAAEEMLAFFNLPKGHRGGLFATLSRMAAEGDIMRINRGVYRLCA